MPRPFNCKPQRRVTNTLESRWRHRKLKHAKYVGEGRESRTILEPYQQLLEHAYDKNTKTSALTQNWLQHVATLPESSTHKKTKPNVLLVAEKPIA